MKRQYFYLAILLSVFSGACATVFSAETATGNLPKIQEGYEGCDAYLAPVITEAWRPVFKLHFEKHREINQSGTFSADGRLLAVTVRTRTYSTTMTFVYDLVEKKNIAWIVNPSRLPSIRVIPVALSTDNKYVVFCDVNDLIAWNLQENEEERRFAFPKTTAITFIEFLDDNTKIRAHLKNDFQEHHYSGGSAATKKNDEIQFLWDFQTGKSIEIPGQPKNPVAKSPVSTSRLCPRTNAVSDDRQIQVKKIGIPQDVKRLEFLDHRAEVTVGFPLEFRRKSDSFTGNYDSHIGNFSLFAGNIHEFLFLPESHVLLTSIDPENPIRNTNPRSAVWVPTFNTHVVPKTEKPSHALVEFWDCDHLIWDMYQANMFPKKIRSVYFEGEEFLFSGVPDSQGKHIFFQAGKRKDQHSQENLHGYIFSLDFDTEPSETVELFLNYEVKVTLPRYPKFGSAQK